MGVCGKALAVLAVVCAIILGLVFTAIFTQTTAPPEVHDGWFGRGPAQRDDDTSVREFKVNVSEDVLNDLVYRLDHARLFEDLEDTEFQYGFRVQYLKDVIRYWKEEYDWRLHETELNRFPQFLTKIEGIDVHFLHVKTPNGVGKPPVLLSHGWPGSVWEFYKLIPRLTDPDKYGGRREDGVDVVIPSIPGYGFSESPHQQGFSTVAAARVFYKLMRRLGYIRFYVQGGDWGSVIGTHMAQLFPSHIKGLHLNMFAPPLFHPLLTVHQLLASAAPSVFLDQNDQARLKMFVSYGFLLQETGYLHIQATKPDTVATGLNDSPIGLAAYILEKFSTWTNAEYVGLADGGLTQHFSLDELLTNVMVYWTTGTIASSTRFYKEHFASSEVHALNWRPIGVPTGLVDAPNELLRVPKPFIGYKYKNVVQYSEFPAGGHFAAFEQPAMMAADILQFVRTVENYNQQ